MVEWKAQRLINLQYWPVLNEKGCFPAVQVRVMDFYRKLTFRWSQSTQALQRLSRQKNSLFKSILWAHLSTSFDQILKQKNEFSPKFYFWRLWQEWLDCLQNAYLSAPQGLLCFHNGFLSIFEVFWRATANKNCRDLGNQYGIEVFFMLWKLVSEDFYRNLSLFWHMCSQNTMVLQRPRKPKLCLTKTDMNPLFHPFWTDSDSKVTEFSPIFRFWGLQEYLWQRFAHCAHVISSKTFHHFECLTVLLEASRLQIPANWKDSDGAVRNFGT